MPLQHHRFLGEVAEVGAPAARQRLQFGQLLRLERLVGDRQDEGENVVDVLAQRHRLLRQPGAQDPDGGADKVLGLGVVGQLEGVVLQRVGRQLLQELEDGAEGVLEGRVQLAALLGVQDGAGHFVAGHVGHGRLDDEVASHQELRVLQDLVVQLLLFQLHDDLDARQVADDLKEARAVGQLLLLGVRHFGQAPLEVRDLDDGGDQDEGGIALRFADFAEQDVVQPLLEVGEPGVRVVVEVGLGVTAQHGANRVAQLELGVVLRRNEIVAQLGHESVEVGGPRVVGPADGAARQETQQQLQRVLEPERLLDDDVAQVVNAAVADEGPPALLAAHDGRDAVVSVRHDQQIVFVHLVVRVVNDIQ